MTIRYLEIFVEVCKYMNMSRAAQSLLISQSSVSQAVKTLEREYDVLLFERLNHNLYLTADGEKLLYLATQVLKSISCLNAAMSNAPVTLSIGACNTVGASLLYPLLAEFKKHCPDIHISAEINNTQTLEEKILNNNLDLAIVPEGAKHDSFKYLLFFDDDIAVVCWPGHRLEGQDAGIEKLKDEIFVGRESGSATDGLLKSVFAKNGFAVKTDCICNSTASVKQAVRHQMGIAFISRYLVRQELAEHKLGCINFKCSDLTRRFVIIYHKDKVLNNEFTRFTGFCSSLGQQGLETLLDGN